MLKKLTYLGMAADSPPLPLVLWPLMATPVQPLNAAASEQRVVFPGQADSGNEFVGGANRFEIVQDGAGMPARKEVHKLNREDGLKTIGDWQFDPNFVSVTACDNGYSFAPDVRGELPQSCIESTEHLMRCCRLWCKPALNRR